MTEIRDARWMSWNRRLARRVLRPFVSTRMEPNHITTARILTGLAACAGFAEGTSSVAVWGGVLWVLSAFLDRCDGEFARMTGRSSRFGAIYDLTGDVVINSGVFLAIGIGTRASFVGPWAIVFGALAATGIAIASVCAEWNERGMAAGEKTFNGIFGFDFDDFVYAIAPFAWFGALEPLLIGAAIGGPVAGAIIAGKLIRKRRRPDAEA